MLKLVILAVAAMTSHGFRNLELCDAESLTDFLLLTQSLTQEDVASFALDELRNIAIQEMSAMYGFNDYYLQTETDQDLLDLVCREESECTSHDDCGEPNYCSKGYGGGFECFDCTWNCYLGQGDGFDGTCPDWCPPCDLRCVKGGSDTCLPSNYRCDGIADCDNAGDEQSCDCSPENHMVGRISGERYQTPVTGDEVYSAEDCCDQCERWANCVAWTYRDITKDCVLRQTIDNLNSERRSWVSGEKATSSLRAIADPKVYIPVGGSIVLLSIGAVAFFMHKKRRNYSTINTKVVDETSAGNGEVHDKTVTGGC